MCVCVFFSLFISDKKHFCYIHYTNFEYVVCPLHLFSLISYTSIVYVMNVFLCFFSICVQQFIIYFVVCMRCDEKKKVRFLKLCFWLLVAIPFAFETDSNSKYSLSYVWYLLLALVTEICRIIIITRVF